MSAYHPVPEGATVTDSYYRERAIEREIAKHRRLLEAAPDLLDALTGLVGLVQLIIPTLEKSQRIGVEFNPRFEVARAAIARATGSTS